MLSSKITKHICSKKWLQWILYNIIQT